MGGLPDQQLLNPGNFVSWRKNMFSFLNPVTLENMKVVNGEVLLDLEEIEGNINHNEIPQQLSELIATENRHFSYANASNVTFLDKMRSVLEDFTQRRIVGAKLVSHYLNETGRKTADGSPWTPRLAFFLIKLTGVSQERPRKIHKARSSRYLKKHRPIKRPKKTKRPNSKKNSVATKTLQLQGKTLTKLTSDVDEWAEMLARLGRVSRKGSEE